MQETNAQPRDRRAFNAYRHGLSGQVLVIPPSEQAAYERHCRGIHQSIGPSGALETDLAQSIADDRWRLKRAAAIESNIFTLGLSFPDQALTGNEESDIALAQARVWLERGKDLELLALYESRIQRRVEKNLALLRQLQRDRREAANVQEIRDFSASHFDRSRPVARASGCGSSGARCSREIESPSPSSFSSDSPYR